MPTKPLTVVHDGPDSVCHHSGLPPSECDYHCPHCESSCIPSPDLAEIQVRAARLRERWTKERLTKQEGTSCEVEIPQVVRVTDHMRRKTDPLGDRLTR
jgi:hypothetical protein